MEESMTFTPEEARAFFVGACLEQSDVLELCIEWLDNDLMLDHEGNPITWVPDIPLWGLKNVLTVYRLRVEYIQ